VDQERIQALAETYDLAFNSWDIESQEVKDAKRRFWILLEESYSEDCPDQNPPYDDYRRQAVLQCKRWLSKGN